MYQVTVGNYMLDGRRYTSYGIRCGAVLVEDLSLCRSEVEALAALCTRERLDPIHLPELAADFLARTDTAVPMTDDTGDTQWKQNSGRG